MMSTKVNGRTKNMIMISKLHLCQMTKQSKLNLGGNSKKLTCFKYFIEPDIWCKDAENVVTSGEIILPCHTTSLSVVSLQQW